MSPGTRGEDSMLSFPQILTPPLRGASSCISSLFLYLNDSNGIKDCLASTIEISLGIEFIDGAPGPAVTRYREFSTAPYDM